MLFARRQRELEARLNAYREKAAECVRLFHEYLLQYLETGDLEELKRNVHRVHRAESEADDIRVEIEVMMYSKALFPESRGDVLGLLEAMDKVPNKAESSIRAIVNYRIEIPHSLHPNLKRLAAVCIDCVHAMFDATTKVFTDFTNAALVLGRIDQLESEADGIEGELMQQIFSDSGIETLEKLLLRELVDHISQIADKSEAVGDRVRIIVAKRAL